MKRAAIDWRDRTRVAACSGSVTHAGCSMRAGSRGPARAVRVADTRAAPPHAAALARELPGIAIETGPFTASTFAGADVIAISPGVDRREQPAIAEAVARGVGLVGDIELFARALPCRGHEGARDHRLQRQEHDDRDGRRSWRARRASRRSSPATSALPVLDALAKIEAGAPWPDVFVLELSSFQLESTSEPRRRRRRRCST